MMRPISLSKRIHDDMRYFIGFLGSFLLMSGWAGALADIRICILTDSKPRRIGPEIGLYLPCQLLRSACFCLDLNRYAASANRS
jgi:hypothetical protein